MMVNIVKVFNLLFCVSNKTEGDTIQHFKILELITWVEKRPIDVIIPASMPTI